MSPFRTLLQHPDPVVVRSAFYALAQSHDVAIETETLLKIFGLLHCFDPWTQAIIMSLAERYLVSPNVLSETITVQFLVCYY